MLQACQRVCSPLLCTSSLIGTTTTLAHAHVTELSIPNGFFLLFWSISERAPFAFLSFCLCLHFDFFLFRY